MRKSRISAIFILAVLVGINLLTGCVQNEELNPEDVWNSPKFKKNLTPQPGQEDEVLRIDLIQYKATPDSKMQDLGYMQTVRLVIPFKKWDDRIYIDGADSSVNVHLDNSFKFARKEANGEIVVYEAVHQLIWQVSDLKGDPIGFINDYGMIFKWESKTGILKNYGTGSFRKAIMLFFNLAWNIQIQENPYDKEWEFGYSRLSEKSSSNFEIVGNDESEKPLVVLKKMDVYQLEQRYQKNLKPLLVRAKDIRGIPVTDAERADAKSANDSDSIDDESSSNNDDDDDDLDDDDDDDDDEDWDDDDDDW